MNVLVFGLSAEQISAVLGDTRVQALNSWPGSIEIEILPAAEEYALVHHGKGEAEKLYSGNN